MEVKLIFRLHGDDIFDNVEIVTDEINPMRGDIVYVPSKTRTHIGDYQA